MNFVLVDVMMSFMKKENPILELSLKFALKIIDYSELLEQHKKYVVARELLRSGTSIGANTNEVQTVLHY